MNEDTGSKPERPDGDGWLASDVECASKQVAAWSMPAPNAMREVAKRLIQMADNMGGMHAPELRRLAQTLAAPVPPDALRNSITLYLCKLLRSFQSAPACADDCTMCIEDDGKSFCQIEADNVLALFALVPAADGAGEQLKAAQRCIARETARTIRLEQTIRDSIEALERNSTSAPVVECLKAALSPSPAVAAEPVRFMRRKKKPTFPAAGPDPWSYVNYADGLIIQQHSEKYETVALYASPTVRGDREAMERECLKAICNAGDRCSCADKNWQWRDRFCDIAMAHVKAIVDRVAFPIQPCAHSSSTGLPGDKEPKTR